MFDRYLTYVRAISHPFYNQTIILVLYYNINNINY